MNLPAHLLCKMVVSDPSRPEVASKAKSLAMGKEVDDASGMRREAATQGAILAGAAVVVVVVMATVAAFLIWMARCPLCLLSWPINWVGKGP